MYIGIDISFAKNIAISWTFDGEEIHFDSIKFEKSELKKGTRDLQQMAKKVFKYMVKEIGISNDEGTHIGIEGQFFSVNPAMVMGLIEIRSLVQGMLLAKYPKIKQSTISPISWQSWLFEGKRKKRNEIKMASIKEAEKIVNKKLTDDEADSINILRYLLENDKNL